MEIKILQSDHLLKAFDLGMGIFETLLVKDGQPLLAKAHYDRLVRGLKSLGFDFNRDFKDFLCDINSAGSKRDLSVVKYSVYIEEANLYIGVTTRPYPYEVSTLKKGFSLMVSSRLQDANDPLNGIKAISYMGRLTELAEIKEKGFDEALRFNQYGHLCEGLKSNVLLKTGTTIKVPWTQANYLRGTTQDFVLSYLKAQGFTLEEGPLYLDDLKNADTILLTNSLIGCVQGYLNNLNRQPCDLVETLRNTYLGGTHERC